MTPDDLLPDLLRLYDLSPTSIDAFDLRWKIFAAHGITIHCPTSTFAWALATLTDMCEDALALHLCRQGLHEPADVSPELGKRASDWAMAERILTHAIECGQDALRCAGMEAEAVAS